MSVKCPVFIVVSDAGTRRSLVEMLRAEQYHATPYAAGSDFLEALIHLPAGVAIVDLFLPDKTGIEILTQLLFKRTDIPAIVTSAEANIQMAVQVIKQGADDFLEQPVSKELLLETIEQVSNLLGPRSAMQKEKDRAKACLQKLTKREIDILRSIELNKSNEAAADELNLSIRTIETYRTRIMKKCGVTKFADAISIFSIAQRGRSI
jgi:two-component system response regulator DctR